MSYKAKSVAAVVVLVVMALFVSRQFFLLAVFRNRQGFLDSPGSLWLAIAAVVACIAGALLFAFFVRHDRKDLPQAPKAPLGSANAAAVDYPTANPPEPVVDALHWAQLNPWLSEGQADDREPMLGTDGDNSGSLASRRSSARRTHQLMYKKWSQARHD